MLSKKMAFSLTSLITIFALAFAVPSAMGATFDTEVTYTEGDTASGRDIVVTIEFITGQTISLDDVKRQRIRVTIVKRDFTSDTYRYVGNASTPGWFTGTIKVDGTGGTAATSGYLTDIIQKDIDPTTTGDQFDGRTFTFTIDETCHSKRST